MASDNDPAASANGKDVASVERVINATPHAIFELLANPARHADIDGSGSVRAADASERLHLGSVFGMNMKLGAKYTMDNTVVEFVEDELIAWRPRARNRLIAMFGGGRIWRYELEPVDGGTRVRETWDIRAEPTRLLLRPLRAKTVKAMTKTLARIDEIVTA